ncbi:MAG: LemA family protein [Thermoguttaceae bacterium]
MTGLVLVLVVVLGGMFAAALVVFFWGVAVYNGLVTLRNRFKNAFAQIDVQLKRRYDLIPNLVETVKGYMKHEKETLENVTMARNQAFGANSRAAANPDDPSAMRGLMSAESNLGGALGRLMVVMEAYPDLKANQNVMALQEELSSTENKISFARQAYNDSVMQYNTAREVFPSNVIAGFCSFREATPFVIENESEKAAPKVSLT